MAPGGRPLTFRVCARSIWPGMPGSYPSRVVLPITAPQGVTTQTKYTPSTAAAICYMTSGFRVISWSRSSRVRWWNHRDRAWWVRVQPDQCSMWPGGHGRVVTAAMSRRTSGTVSGIMPGSGGGAWPGRTGGGGWGAGGALVWGAGDGPADRGGLVQSELRGLAVAE